MSSRSRAFAVKRPLSDPNEILTSIWSRLGGDAFAVNEGHSGKRIFCGKDKKGSIPSKKLSD